MNTRSYKFDNIKAVLIFLVVLCHFFELFNGYAKYRIYMFVYSFHMPVFVFVSGYFARFKIENIICKQLYTYVIFQSLFCAMFSGYIQFTMPYWHLWYILCLMIWNITLLFVKKGMLIWLAISTVASVLIGCININSSYLSVYRLFSFYPFFLFGYYCGNKQFFKDNNIKKYFYGILLAVIAGHMAYKLIYEIDSDWLYRSKAYETIGCTVFDMIKITSLSFVWCIAFPLAMPDKKIPFITDIGKYSICVFLLHGFIQRSMRKWYNIFTYSQTLNIIISLIITICICLLAGNKFTFKILQPFTDLKYVIPNPLHKKNNEKNI